VASKQERKIAGDSAYSVANVNVSPVPDVRNQYLKAVAEMSWMDYWVRGSGKKFAWRDVLSSVEAGGPQLAGQAVMP
jgi:hypothetical protein